MRSISSRIELTTALNSIPTVLARGLHDDRELEVVREVEAAAIGSCEHRGMNAVELEDLLRVSLVLRIQQAV
jgi:hypothetical protein